MHKLPNFSGLPQFGKSLNSLSWKLQLTVQDHTIFYSVRDKSGTSMLTVATTFYIEQSYDETLSLFMPHLASVPCEFCPSCWVAYMKIHTRLHSPQIFCWSNNAQQFHSPFTPLVVFIQKISKNVHVLDLKKKKKMDWKTIVLIPFCCTCHWFHVT